MTRKGFLILAIFASLLTTDASVGWAADEPGISAAPVRPRAPRPVRPPPQCTGRRCGDAPELDAASAISAIVLVSGGLLLMKERSRSRRRRKEKHLS
jgi:hypothetical protein